MKIKRIGILTGGGDVPGLNTVIHDVTLRAQREEIEVYGIRRGWGGLVYMDPDGKGDDSQNLIILNSINVRKIDRTGGTILHTSRTNPMNVSSNVHLEKFRGIKLEKKTDMTADVLKNIDRLGIDALIVIGGDDTLKYSVYLKKLGIKIIAVPKTMDNDVNGTEYSIGFSSAISKSMNIINDLRTPMGSHERFGVIELFGRNAGFTVLYTGYVTREVRILIPEWDFDLDKLVELLMEDRHNNPMNYALVLVSEGAKPIGETIRETGPEDQYGHRKLGGISQDVAHYIQLKTGYHTILQVLGYIMRSGAPDAVDKLVSGIYANIAMDCVLQNEFGVMTSIIDGHYTVVPVDLITEKKRVVDIDRYYNTERYCPKFENMRGLPLFLS